MSIKIKNTKSATELAGHIERNGEVFFNAGATTGAKKSEYKFNDMAVTVPGTNLQVTIKPQETYEFSASKSSIAGLALDSKAKEIGAEIIEDKPTPVTNEYAFTTTFVCFDAFSTESTYAVGDKVTYQMANYECKEAIETAGEWDESKWTDLDNYGFTIAETTGNEVVVAEDNDGTLSSEATITVNFEGSEITLTADTPMTAKSKLSDGSVVIGSGTLPEGTMYFEFPKYFTDTNEGTYDIAIVYADSDWLIFVSGE